MSVDGAILYGPQYAILGDDAQILLDDGLTTYPIRAIDKTTGIAVGGTIDVPTIVPAACIYYPDLVALDLVPDQLVDAELTLNGKTWRIDATRPAPGMSGEASGELWLILREA
jgi:hypothetical protein